jgi:hypothetical protein
MLRSWTLTLEAILCGECSRVIFFYAPSQASVPPPFGIKVANLMSIPGFQ